MNVMDELRKEIETTYEYKCGYVKGRADAIDEFNNAIKNFVRRNGTIPNNFNSDMIAEQLKEQKND